MFTQELMGGNHGRKSWEEIMSDRSAMPPAVSALAAGAIAVVALLAAPAQVRSADEFEVTITIKDHKFDPAEIRVPAGKGGQAYRQESGCDRRGVRKQDTQGGENYRR
jgi:hypothetical protein